jgi:hypothetical protein
VISPENGQIAAASTRLKARCASTASPVCGSGIAVKSAAACPASGSAIRQPVARTTRLPSATRRAATPCPAVASKGGIAPPRLAPSTSTTVSAGSVPKDRISITTASEDEQITASPAAKASATGQASPSIPRNAAMAGDSRKGTVACDNSASDSSISAMPISASPAPDHSRRDCRRRT